MTSNRQINSPTIALAIVVGIATGLLLHAHPSLSAVEFDAQKRPPKKPSRRPKPAADTNKYAKFTHDTHGNKSDFASARNLTCTNCHSMPLAAEPDQIGDTRQPPGARGYPYHNACFPCHQREIFRGDHTAICTVCHTRVSPRATAQDVAQFPNQPDISPRQFTGYFPHSSHRKVICTVKADCNSAGALDSSKRTCQSCHTSAAAGRL